MTKKIFGTKQITHLIYGILMLLPFLSILSTCCYVAINKNAKDSYYGDNINEQYSNLVKYNDLKVNYEYYYQNASDTTTNTESTNVNIYITNFKINGNYVANNNPTWDIEDANIFRILAYTNDNYLVYQYRKDNESGYYYNTSANTINVSFVLINNITQNSYLNERLVDFVFYSYNKDSFLDNAFDYSISKFVKDNDNYNIHFFDWFGNLFLKNGNTGVNATYLNFINWYLNYALLVSVGYILFLLMLWFINFVRKILEGGNSFGHGGF